MDFIQDYFEAEQTQSLILILIGLIAILVSTYFYFKVNKELFNGITISLVTIAVMQIAMGSSVYIQTPNQHKRAEYFVSKAKSMVDNEEIPRMEKVTWRLMMYKFIEIAAIISGILIVLYAKTELYKGVGYGIIVQAFILLVMDFIGDNRAQKYLEALQSIT